MISAGDERRWPPVYSALLRWVQPRPRITWLAAVPKPMRPRWRRPEPREGTRSSRTVELSGPDQHDDRASGDCGAQGRAVAL